MKKLLIPISLVFWISLLASAGLTWSQNEITLGAGQTVTVQLITSDGATGKAWMAGDLTIASYTITPLPNAGDDASAYVYTTGSYAGWGYVDIVELPLIFVPGPVFDVTFTGVSIGTITMSSDYYSSFGAPDYLTIIRAAIPEPLTIGLLALGGLFLRRRK